MILSRFPLARAHQEASWPIRYRLSAGFSQKFGYKRFELSTGVQSMPPSFSTFYQ